MNKNHQTLIKACQRWQAKVKHPQPDTRQAFRKLYFIRLAVENLMVLLLQYMGVKMTGLTPSPLWFASGTSCAFMFIRGISILPGMWLGTFCAYFLANVRPSLAFACATVHTCQILAILWISYRWIDPFLIFFQLKKFIKFLVSVSFITAIASYLLVHLCYQSLSNPASTWLEWWIANLNGILIFSLAIATWDFYFTEVEKLKRVNLLLTALLYGLLLVIIFALIFSHLSFTPFLLFLTCMISMRFGWCGATAANFLIGLLLGFAISLFGINFSAQLINLQLFLLVETILVISISIIKQPSR